MQGGRPGAAAALLESYLRDTPEDAKCWLLLGACRHALNDVPAAAEAFARSLALNPTDIQTHLAYISVLRASGDFQRALAASQNALTVLPNEPQLMFAAGLCLEDVGNIDGALSHYDAALQLAPDHEDALQNRGVLLCKIGRYKDAEANHRRYIAMHPQAARAHSGLADILLAEGAYPQAIEVLTALEQLLPQDTSAVVRLGVAYAAMGDFAKAREIFNYATALNPNAVMEFVGKIAPGADPDAVLSPQNVFINRAWDGLGHCDWSRWDRLSGELQQLAWRRDIAIEPAVGFVALHAPSDGVERTAIAAQVARGFENRIAALPRLMPQPRSQIRIGIVTPDIRDHVVAYMLAPLFELVDRNRFAMYCYSLGLEDGSEIRKRIRNAAAAFRDVASFSDYSAACSIRKDDIDILIDPAGHTTGGRFAIVAHRPARLHVNYLGYSGSLGSSRLDYAIVDRIVGNSDREWIETRVFLPHTFLLYDFRDPEPIAVPTRDEYGLPVDAMVYCAFHKPEKITPDIFRMWMEILKSVPGSVLWFGALPEDAIGRLRTVASSQHIDPTRLVVAPFESNRSANYLGRHALGDLLLDVPHHNAINSACDALRMGLPILTLTGTAMASRACTSILNAAHMPDLAVRDATEYVNAGVRYGRDLDLLRSLKQRLHANRRTAPLFDTTGRVRELEAAFQGMYDRMMRGEPPASFDVQL
jgi:protein O-GlcNAc transferase